MCINEYRRCRIFPPSDAEPSAVRGRRSPALERGHRSPGAERGVLIPERAFFSGLDWLCRRLARTSTWLTRKKSIMRRCPVVTDCWVTAEGDRSQTRRDCNYAMAARSTVPSGVPSRYRRRAIRRHTSACLSAGQGLGEGPAVAVNHHCAYLISMACILPRQRNAAPACSLKRSTRRM